MRKKVRSFKRVSVSCHLMLAFGFILSANISLAEISIDSYCQITIESMQQEVGNMQELIAIINQYKDDPQTLAQLVQTKQAEFDQARDELYFSFNTDANEYVSFMSRNSKQVKAYLAANPDMKQQIDNLSAQLNELSEQEQALMGGDEPPPPAQ